MTQDEAFQLLRQIFKSTPDLRLRQPIDSLQTTHRFKQDLGFDSLAVISLLIELQDRFPHLTEADAAKWKTLGDCLESLVKS
jgi:acyl carrier protein